jgi:catechol 2,3-dioxygenase-like lactoylglutathione lyase family enzyme
VSFAAPGGLVDEPQLKWRIEMTETERTTHITEVGAVIVPVSDQDRALDFYLGTLGFEKRLDAPFGEGGRWIEVAPVGAATTLALADVHVPRPGRQQVPDGAARLT